MERAHDANVPWRQALCTRLDAPACRPAGIPPRRTQSWPHRDYKPACRARYGRYYTQAIAAPASLSRACAPVLQDHGRGCWRQRAAGNVELVDDDIGVRSFAVRLGFSRSCWEAL
jgi:hypothetical protein